MALYICGLNVSAAVGAGRGVRSPEAGVVGNFGPPSGSARN